MLKEDYNDRYVITMDVSRDGYSPRQVLGRTCTVGDLMDALSEFDVDEKIVTRHDRGYTYGAVSRRDLREIDTQEDVDESFKKPVNEAKFPWEYKGSNSQSILDALDALEEAIDTVIGLWDDNAEGVDLNELDANNLYPFPKSLDDFNWDVDAWIDAVKEEVGQAGVKTESRALGERFEEYKVVDESGKEIKKGDEITDFRGAKWIFDGITKAPGGGSSGKINAKQSHGGKDDWEQEFYPSVFDFKIVKRESINESKKLKEAKLSKSDREYLRKLGETEDEDINQIEYAIGKTIYTLDDENGKEKRISAKKAREILGDEKFLSGLQRSAFHWDSSRESDDGITVYFDSSAIFKESKSNKKGKKLNETWAGEDLIRKFVDYVKMDIDDGYDVDDAVTDILNNQLIYSKDILTLAQHYGVLDDSELLDKYYEDLYNDLYNAASDYYDEVHADTEDEEEFEESLKRVKSLVEHHRGKAFLWDEDELLPELEKINNIYKKGVENLVSIPYSTIKKRYPEFAKWFEKYHESMEGNDEGELDENSVPVDEYWETLDDVDIKAVLKMIGDRHKKNKQTAVAYYMQYADKVDFDQDEKENLFPID